MRPFELHELFTRELEEPDVIRHREIASARVAWRKLRDRLAPSSSPRPIRSFSFVTSRAASTWTCRSPGCHSSSRRWRLRNISTSPAFESQLHVPKIFCLTGPLRYERIVHLSCHTILYAGIVLVGVAAAMHWVDRRRSRAVQDS